MILVSPGSFFSTWAQQKVSYFSFSKPQVSGLLPQLTHNMGLLEHGLGIQLKSQGSDRSTKTRQTEQK